MRILIDTNAILEAHRTNTWKCITRDWSIETCETCIEESLRRPMKQSYIPVSGESLREGIRTRHDVNDLERTQLALDYPNSAVLDKGERDLMTLLLSKKDTFSICSPDKTAMRFAIEVGLGERLICFESLLKKCGKPAFTLREQYTLDWHSRRMSQLRLGLLI